MRSGNTIATDAIEPKRRMPISSIPVWLPGHA
jgi:hypothetical protein